MWRLPGVARASPGVAAISSGRPPLGSRNCYPGGDVLAALRRETSTAQTVPVLRVGSAHPTLPGALLADPLVQIPAFGPVNRLPRRNRRSRIALRTRRSRPRRDCQDGHRHRNNHPEDEHESVRFRCHVFLLAPDRCAVADVEVERRDICDARHTSVV